MGRLLGVTAALAAVLAVIWVCCRCGIRTVPAQKSEPLVSVPAATESTRPEVMNAASLMVGELVCLDSGVAGLKVYNTGSVPISRAEVALWQGDRQLRFAMGYIPAFSGAVVEEKYQTPFDSALVSNAQIIEIVAMERWDEKKVRVEESGAFQLEIRNLTKETLRDVRVYYKAYDPEKQCYIGGVTYCLVLTRLLPEESRVVSPYLYVQGHMKVVAVQIGQ